MSCGVCSKLFSSQRRPTCPSCAVATTYESRYQYAALLVDKDRLRHQVETVIQFPATLVDLPPASQSVELTEAAKKLIVEDERRQIASIDSRVVAIREQQALLRSRIDQARANNAARRRDHTERRLVIRDEAMRFSSIKGNITQPLQAEITRLNSRLTKIRDRTIDGRRKLCRETAKLAGLGLRRRRAKDGQIKDDYVIGRLSIPDLRDINTARPDSISAALASVCRLLTVTCQYLSIRPPAEMIAPHSSHPRPMILSLQSSYQAEDDPSSTLPRFSSSRVLSGRSAMPKARLLSIDTSLPRLAKADPPRTYNLFVEGVTLLAWNVAWLCRAQGITADLNTWEDVCCIGRNLSRLLLAMDEISTESVRFGEYSHGSTHKNLAGPAGSDLMIQTWDMPPLATITDKIKSYLLTEMSGAEWELLDEKEWIEERDDERAVLVGGSSSSKAVPSTQDSTIRATQAAVDSEDGQDTGRPKGEKGWMKLKSRANET